ncbi:uncharacterized protein LOC135094239 isoform X2 [Scylla paramamosain]|uniref:uncharacterized protein LOC135094239 isoform X2 n=1 Tax=Scylla paramamosain TaxID=85552 RepID=UPI003083CB13
MGLLPPQDTRSIAEALRKTSQPLTQRTQLCTEAGTGFSQHLAWSLQQKEATPASSTTTIYPPLSLPAMLTLSLAALLGPFHDSQREREVEVRWSRGGRLKEAVKE